MKYIATFIIASLNTVYCHFMKKKIVKKVPYDTGVSVAVQCISTPYASGVDI